MLNQPTAHAVGSQDPYGTIDPDWFAARVQADPWLFHVTRRQHLAAIATEGLRPVADSTTMQSHPGAASNPHAVYLGTRTLARDGWLHEWTGLHGLDAALVAIDLRQIDPTRLIADEDAVAGLLVDVGIDPGCYGLPVYDPQRWSDFGRWAADVRLGAQPGIVEESWSEHGTLAHLGPIPPDVLLLDVAAGTVGTRPA